MSSTDASFAFHPWSHPQNHQASVTCRKLVDDFLQISRTIKILPLQLTKCCDSSEGELVGGNSSDHHL